MKTRVFLLALVILLACTIIFTACNSNNTSNDNNNTQENSENVENDESNQNSNNANNLLNTPLAHRVENGTCIITGIGSYTDSKLIIPSKIDDVPVVAISKGAFKDCKQIQELYLPASVTNVGELAFNGCSNITKIDIESLSIWCNNNFGAQFDDGYANGYDSASLYINGVSAEEITIPDDVKIIPEYCFQNFVNIKKITIPSHVTEMDGAAIWECLNLEYIYIAPSVTKVGYYSVMDIDTCASLKYANIPICVANNIFFNSVIRPKNLETLIINSGEGDIDDNAFYECENLKTLVILSESNIGSKAFRDCRKLTTVILSDEIEEIGFGAFEMCVRLETVYLGKGLTDIESNVFYECEKLKSVYFSGTRDEWNDIVIDDDLIDGTIYFNTKQPDWETIQ